MVDIDANEHGPLHIDGQTLNEVRVDCAIFATDLAIHFQQKVVEVTTRQSNELLGLKALRYEAKFLVTVVLHKSIQVSG